MKHRGLFHSGFVVLNLFELSNVLSGGMKYVAGVLTVSSEFGHSCFVR